MLHPGRGAAAAVLGRAVPRRPRRPRRRVYGLHDALPRPDPPVRAARTYAVLGTDGFGRSDYRVNLRRLFEVDRHHVALAALTHSPPRAPSGRGCPARRSRSYGIDPERPAPLAGLRRIRWRRSTRSWFPTSAISTTYRSSRCSWRRATRSRAEDPLVTLESDKATMDVPSPAERCRAEISVSVGDKVSRGLADPRCSSHRRQRRRPARAGRAGRAPRPAARPSPRPAAIAASRAGLAAAAPARPQDGAGDARLRQPAVRRLARELGVDLSGVQGPGRKGRITKEDVERPPTGGRPRRGAGGAGRRLEPGPVAEGRLREVRRGRAPAALADQADPRPEPGPQLGDDPARHAQRRGGHHRARGVPQAHQRRARQRGSR